MYRYFVSYAFTTIDGNNGFGNFVIERNVQIASSDDIRNIERLSMDTIVDKQKNPIEVRGMTILHIVSLPL